MGWDKLYGQLILTTAGLDDGAAVRAFAWLKSTVEHGRQAMQRPDKRLVKYSGEDEA